MIERLFLEGVDAKTAGAAIACQNNFVMRAGADEAQSALALPELADSGAEVALDPPVFELMPVLGGDD